MTFAKHKASVVHQCKRLYLKAYLCIICAGLLGLRDLNECLSGFGDIVSEDNVFEVRKHRVNSKEKKQ